MKTKLTLTVQKEVIESAKRMAKERNVSVSRLFEEAFEEDTIQPILSEKQKAARRFLKNSEERQPIQALDKSDKELIREHIEKKYG